MKHNLVDELFDKNKNFQMGIFCTYSLNIDFLENYLLNLKGVGNCSSLCVFTDRGIYQNNFMMNSYSKPKWINKRYLVIPVDTNGVFHPKLYLLASDKMVRMGIGSANLTREGIASNLEIVSIFEVSEKDKTYSGLLKECLTFLHELAIHSQSVSAQDSITNFISLTNHLLPSEQESSILFLHNLKDSIMKQVIEKLDGCEVTRIKVISPFYDNNLKVHHFLQQMYPEIPFTIYIQQGKSNFPVDKYKEIREKTSIFLYREQNRYIHGKALIFETEKGAYLLTGSANYTKSALLSNNLTGNVETAIFGKVDNKTVNELCEPKGVSSVSLTDIKNLEVTPIEEHIQLEEGIIQDWLIEVLYINKQLEITINNKRKFTPTYIILNDNKDTKIEYNSIISLNDTNKSELTYAQIEGLDNNNQTVRSGKVWIINLEKAVGYTGSKRLYINDAEQITEILLDLIKNGSEEELIEYLLRFDIPLDLVGFRIGRKIPGAMESKGNVFGELIQQSKSSYITPAVFQAAQQFLSTNFNKLNRHYHDTQLNKLDNFMLIYGTMFNMMSVFNDYLVSNNKRNPIDASDWVMIRDYFDLMLEYIEKTLSLLWVRNEHKSFEDRVNDAIKNDNQKLLGNISSFKSFIVKREYATQYKSSLINSRVIIKRLNRYIEKGKIKTVFGTLVNAPIANNGMKDIYINKRKHILKLIKMLINDFEQWGN